MTPAEKLAHYAAENAAIIYVLALLVIILGASLVYVLILYILEIIKTKSFRKREAQLARELGQRAQELVRLRDLVGDIEALKKDLQRNILLRDKAFKRLTDQNDIVERQNGRIKRRDATIADLNNQVETLKAMTIAHGGGEPGRAT